ncbi:hypothetical protein [Rhizobacter sp. P5_C2]
MADITNTTRRHLLAGGALLALTGSAKPREPVQRPFYAPVSTGEDRGPPIPQRTATTRKLFKCPAGYPNALSSSPAGLWIAEQRVDNGRERIWLVDGAGAVLQATSSDATDTSGVAYGDGVLWVCANSETNHGVYETSLDGRTLSHRQIPLGPAEMAGGCHGATWHDGFLWVTANRPRAILRIDPKTWTVAYLIPFGLPEGLTRYHGCAVLGDSMYMVSGGESRTYADGQTNLIRYDLATGVIREIVNFAPGSCDPHGLAVHEGRLIACDSGLHPGWDSRYDVPGLGKRTSPGAGWVFEVELEG